LIPGSNKRQRSSADAIEFALLFDGRLDVKRTRPQTE
jgi:hypothetical protein